MLFSRLLMQWTAPTTGIAMYENAVAIADRRESAYGYKETSSGPKSMSALPPRADVAAAESGTDWGAAPQQAEGGPERVVRC